MIKLCKANKGVEHGAKLKDRMSHAEGIHIDQECLSITDHEVVCMIIAVHHGMLIRTASTI